MKKLEEISKLGQLNAASGKHGKTLEVQFENFIPHMMEQVRETKSIPEKIRLYYLGILANLSLKANLRKQIMAADGVDLYLNILIKPKPEEDDDREPIFQSIEAQRYAARGLVNLVSSKRDIRLQALTALSSEISMIYQGKMDEIVGTYLKQLVVSSEKQTSQMTY